jgi:hypothetical protein
MREDSAHARNHDLSAAAKIFAKGTYFPNSLVLQRLPEPNQVTLKVEATLSSKTSEGSY